MQYILDIIILAICVITVLVSWKRGLFRSVMSLVSGVAALLVAYAFSPTVAAFLKAKVFLSAIAGGVVDTLASMAKTGAEGAGAVVYDLSKLLDNDQFLSILNQYGASSEKIAGMIQTANDGSREAVETIAYAVADPIASLLSRVTAFFGLFVAALIVLKLLTWVVGLLFHLPVLKQTDRTLGLAFGVLTALLFVWVFSAVAGNILTALSSIAPGTFDPALLERSILLRFFAAYNPIEFIGKLIGNG